MNKVLRILIVDDQRRARQSLKALLATRFQPIEIREAENGIDAIRCAEEWRPHVVLMDARMPDMDGIEATRAIKRQASHVKVIVFSMYGEYRAPAASAGADAFISKDEQPERLLAAVSAAIGAAQEPQSDDGQAP